MMPVRGAPGSRINCARLPTYASPSLPPRLPGPLATGSCKGSQASAPVCVGFLARTQQRLVILVLAACTLPVRGQSVPPSSGRCDLNGDLLPSGALSRLGSVRLRHSYPLRSVAIGPGGKLLASLDERGLLCTWDFATGRLLQRFACPRGPRGCRDRLLAFSPSGARLAVASGKEVLLVDPRTGEQKGSLPHKGEVLSVQYSPDGKTLASGTADGTLTLWDTGRRKVRGFFPGADMGIRGDARGIGCVVFSPDGKNLVSEGYGKVLKVWDPATGGLLRTLDWRDPEEKTAPPREIVVLTRDGKGVSSRETLPPSESITSGAFTPNGKAVAVSTASTGKANGGVYLIDPASGKKLRRFDGEYRGANSVAFSPDGSLLAAVVWNWCGILVWEVASGRRIFQSPEHISESVSFTPDGHTLVSGTPKGTIRMWDVASGKERKRPAEHCEGVLAIGFTPDGRTVVTRSLDRTIRLWDPATGRARLLVPPAKEHFQEFYDRLPEIQFFPDGGGFLSQQEAHGLSLRDGASGVEVHKFTGLDFDISTYAFSPDGKVLAVRTLDKRHEERSVHVLDAFTGQEVRRLRDPANVYRDCGFFFGYHGPLRFSPEGKVLASASYNKVRLWEMATGKELYQLAGHKGHIHALTFFPGGRLLATEGGGRETDFSPRYRSFDRTNRIWDLISGRQLSVVDDKEAPFWRAFAPDERTYAATAMEDVLLCEAATGKPMLRFTNPRTECEAVAYSPDAERLAAGYHDGIGLVWDLTPQGWQAPTAKATPEQLRQFWTDLAAEDAPRAHLAIYTLAHHGAPALAFLRERLKPVPKDFAERLRQSIADLDADNFRTRELAMRELTRLGPDAVLPLHAALDAKPSGEARNRIEALLKELHPWYIKDPETLRTVRAIWVLQRMATPEARAVLDSLASGAPEARITQEAQAALRFLDRNRKP
jgi:WD40 repeat protein